MLGMKLPTDRHQPKMLLGMINFHWDMWPHWSHAPAPPKLSSDLLQQITQHFFQQIHLLLIRLTKISAIDAVAITLGQQQQHGSHWQEEEGQDAQEQSPACGGGGDEGCGGSIDGIGITGNKGIDVVRIKGAKDKDKEERCKG